MPHLARVGETPGAPTLQSVCRKLGWLALPRDPLGMTRFCQHISLKDIWHGPHHPSSTAARILPCMACCFGGVLCSKLREIYVFLSTENVCMQSSFKRAIHKAMRKVKKVYFEVITTVHGSNPLAEKIQKGFDKEAAV